jgi:hypothetical protein
MELDEASGLDQRHGVVAGAARAKPIQIAVNDQSGHRYLRQYFIEIGRLHLKDRRINLRADHRVEREHRFEIFRAWLPVKTSIQELAGTENLFI